MKKNILTAMRLILNHLANAQTQKVINEKDNDRKATMIQLKLKKYKENQG